MSESSSAVVAGHICLDIIPRLKGESADLLEKLLVPGRLTVVGPAILTRVLPHVDVFLSSIEELLYILRPATYEDLR
jgi:hypothetical protein